MWPTGNTGRWMKPYGCTAMSRSCQRAHRLTGSTRNEGELAVALFGSAWPLFVETDLHAEGRARYSQILGLLADSLPRERLGRFWEAIGAYDSTRQQDRTRYAAELAAEISARRARGPFPVLRPDGRLRGLAVDAATAQFRAAPALQLEILPPRLLAHGALTEGAMLMETGRITEARASFQRGETSLTTSAGLPWRPRSVSWSSKTCGGDTAGALQLAGRYCRPPAPRPAGHPVRMTGHGFQRALLIAGEDRCRPVQQAQRFTIRRCGLLTLASFTPCSMP